MSNFLPMGRWYQAGVLMGNWHENAAREQDIIKDMLQKRDEGTLVCEKNVLITQAVTAKQELSTSPDGMVHFGNVVMLVCPASPPRPPWPPLGPSTLRPLPHALTQSWPDLLSHSVAETVCAPSVAIAASSCHLSPNVRNCFRVTSCDGSHDGEMLRYSQPFYLTSVDRRLYLRGDSFSFERLTKYAHKPQVVMEDYPHALAEWAALPLHPRARTELQYCPVQANTKVVLRHRHTNQSLCLEPFPCRSSFGDEVEVTVQTRTDSHRAETDVNHWLLALHAPSDCHLPVIEPNWTPHH